MLNCILNKILKHDMCIPASHGVFIETRKWSDVTKIF